MSGADEFADNGSVQLTLREVSSLMGDFRFWLSMGAVTFILAISAPFGTGDSLSFGELVTYWAVVAVTTFVAALFVSRFVALSLRGLGIGNMAGSLLGGVVAGLPVTLIVLSINSLVFEDTITADSPLWLFALQCTGISVAVVTVFALLDPDNNGGKAEPSRIVEAALLHRLAPQTGSDIISLQAQDHYVEVVTTRGREMLLMRLSDAIAETDGIAGEQIHRSWWIAKEHLKEVSRAGDRVEAVLSDGRRVPVSRGKVKRARAMLATN